MFNPKRENRERSDHIYVKINASANSFIRAKKTQPSGCRVRRYLRWKVGKGKRDDPKATISFSWMKILLQPQIKFGGRFKRINFKKRLKKY